MADFNRKDRDIFIGNQIAKLLNLKFDAKGECKTDWGTKTAQGLGAVVTRIVEDSVVQFGGEVVDVKPLVLNDSWCDENGRNPLEDDFEYMTQIRRAK